MLQWWHFFKLFFILRDKIRLCTKAPFFILRKTNVLVRSSSLIIHLIEIHCWLLLSTDKFRRLINDGTRGWVAMLFCLLEPRSGTHTKHIFFSNFSSFSSLSFSSINNCFLSHYSLRQSKSIRCSANWCWVHHIMIAAQWQQQCRQSHRATWLGLYFYDFHSSGSVRSSAYHFASNGAEEKSVGKRRRRRTMSDFHRDFGTVKWSAVVSHRSLSCNMPVVDRYELHCVCNLFHSLEIQCTWVGTWRPGRLLSYWWMQFIYTLKLLSTLAHCRIEKRSEIVRRWIDAIVCVCVCTSR